MNEPELYNGQVWRQLKFPCFEIVVIMLTHGKEGLEFCKMGTGSWKAPPLIMTDENGRLRWTQEALLANLKFLKYTPVGEARIKVVEDGINV